MHDCRIIGIQAKGYQRWKCATFLYPKEGAKANKQAKQTSWLDIEDIKPRLKSLKSKAICNVYESSWVESLTC